MLTPADLHAFLRQANIRPTDTVLVHTSMRALGPVEGGCDGLIDAFCTYLNEGLFLVPTHTWANVTREQPIFDVNATLPCIGALPTVAAFRKDGVRSLHPTHSMAAFGSRAAAFLRGEESAQTPCPKGGAWARLKDEDATILLLGVGLNRYTFLHAVDEMLDLNHFGEPFPVTVINQKGERTTQMFRPHHNTGSEFFENYRKPLEALGALKQMPLGNTTVGVCSARKTAEVLRLLWQKAEYNLCETFRDIPNDYYL